MSRATAAYENAMLGRLNHVERAATSDELAN
jgi:hypothetical protein